MSILDWAFESNRLAGTERLEESRRAAVARAQVKALRRAKRRDQLARVRMWCGRHKLAFYPVSAVASFSVGAFTASVLAGFVVMGLGLLALEWRFSR